MILPQSAILREVEARTITFDPAPGRDQFQSASVDLRLSPHLRLPQAQEHLILSPGVRLPQDVYGVPTEIPPGGYNLQPGEFLLGNTLENVTVPTTSPAGSKARAASPGWAS